VEVGPPVFSLLPPTLVAGSTARVDARFADPGAQVAFFGSSLPGAGPTCAPAGAPCVELRQARWLGTDTADALGNARTRIPVPAGVAPGTPFWLQAVELGPQPKISEVVAVTVAR
jgi:hypothetical protein